jgi:hypothetical protein
MSPPTKGRKKNLFIKTSNFIAHEKLCKKREVRRLKGEFDATCYEDIKA